MKKITLCLFKKNFKIFLAGLSILSGMTPLQADTTEEASDFYVELGKEAYQRRDFTQASYELRKALKINPHHPEARRLIREVNSVRDCPQKECAQKLAIMNLELDVLQLKISSLKKILEENKKVDPKKDEKKK